MARYGAPVWRGLALAAATAAALALLCAPRGEAQTAPAAKKGKQKQTQPKKSEPQQAESEQDGEAKAPAKKKKMTAAEAQAVIDAAAKLIDAGKTDQAVQSLNTLLTAGRLPPAIMAKALVYRGMAYRHQKKPALAIADLTSALWLKGGLSESDRRDALGQRTAAYQEAGLTETGESATAAAAPRAAPPAASPGFWGGTTTASAAPPPPSASLASESAAPTPPAPKSSAGGWNLFGGLFEPWPAPAAAPPAPQPIVATERAQPEARPAPSVSAWSSATEVRGAPPTETAALPARAEGQFRVQVGMVRTQDQAQALAAKVKGQYAAALGQREPLIDEAVVGNMGSFYRVRVGPFVSSQEGQAACAKLKGSGLDCLVVTQ